jgi:3-hydroxyisobutyrate dehydrogenase-like beta-hydroxyacid dehydrogenase
MSKVGFIGVGTMGASFASNLQKAGFELVIYDLDKAAAAAHLAAGATWAKSPHALAEQVDTVLLSLPGPSEVEAVVLNSNSGLVAGLKPGSAIFDLSTNSPKMVRSIHAELAEKGIHLFDAPVSGGPRGAASGKLAIWVGGDEAEFNARRAPLDAMGDQVKYIGSIGAGSVAKLVHNGAGYAMQCALGEIFTVGVKAGVEPVALWEAIRQGARGRQRSFDNLTDHYLINNYDPPDFALKLALKDVTLAAEMGRDLGVPMRMTQLAHAEMTEAMSRGWEGRDSRAYMLLQQERAELSVAADAEAIKKVIDSDSANS